MFLFMSQQRFVRKSSDVSLQALEGIGEEERKKNEKIWELMKDYIGEEVN